MRSHMHHVGLAALLLASGFCLAGNAVGAESPIQMLKLRMERPAEVLVLATPHLSGVEGVTASHVEHVVAALAAFAPKAVVVEALPPHTIEAMQQQADQHPEALDAFVGPRFRELALESQRMLGVDPAAARKALASECAKALPATAEASLRCIRLTAATWDKPWADYLVWRHGRQWPASVPEGMLGDRIGRIAKSTNENELIAARLADQFGHPRLYGMDDHPGEDVYGPVFEALVPAIGQSKAYASFKAEARVIKEAGERTRQAVAAEDLLPLYRWFNSPEHSGLVLDEEWRLFVDRDLPRGPGQARIGLWDVRNLAMVSNVLRVVSRHPGERVLVIVGASHKPFFDDYLQRSIGVRVRQFDEFAPNTGQAASAR